MANQGCMSQRSFNCGGTIGWHHVVVTVAAAAVKEITTWDTTGQNLSSINIRDNN